MIVATPVTKDGLSAAAWGKAHWIGVADVTDGAVRSWQVHEVAWDESHDEGTHGSHHARIVRFLKDQGIMSVVVDHMGPGMVQVMGRMGIPLLPASAGDAQESILAALEAPPARPDHTKAAAPVSMSAGTRDVGGASISSPRMV